MFIEAEESIAFTLPLGAVMRTLAKPFERIGTLGRSS
jgi:hypothetical protein